MKDSLNTIDNMNKEEFIALHDAVQKPLIEKYGLFLTFLGTDVLTIGYVEKVCEAKGYTSKRVHYGGGSIQFYSELYLDGKIVGVISNQGLPCVEFYKRKRKLAVALAEHPDIIAPIVGVHRVLGWHDVKGKLHCLAGGETVLHFKPLNITDEMMETFLIKTNLMGMVEKLKADEKERKIKNE